MRYSNTDNFAALFAALQRSRFRSRFRLDTTLQAYANEKTLAVVLDHARRLIGTRLAPARPDRDGRQTPTGGHPVFVAQHATATCCRKCLARWHGIARSQPLSDEQVSYVVAVIGAWLKRQGVADEELPLLRNLAPPSGPPTGG